MTIRTLDFGVVPVRSNPLYTDGTFLTEVELSNGDYVSIKLDYKTNQPFAVINEEI